MERKEFENVMEEYKFTPVGVTEYNYDMRAVYKDADGDLNYFYGGTFYAVVKGRVPLEVANTIYKKYPQNEYEIRVMGNTLFEVPSAWARDDMFDEDVCKYGIHEAFNKLKNRVDSKKYITTYHIDTIDGLKIFIDEMRKYLAKKNPTTKAPTRVLKQDK